MRINVPCVPKSEGSHHRADEAKIEDSHHRPTLHQSPIKFSPIIKHQPSTTNPSKPFAHQSSFRWRRQKEDLAFVRTREKDASITEFRTFSQAWQKNEGVSKLTLLLLATGPAIIVLLNALKIGMSSDLHPEHGIWNVLEKIWIGCYTLEFLAKCSLASG